MMHMLFRDSKGEAVLLVKDADFDESFLEKGEMLQIWEHNPFDAFLTIFVCRPPSRTPGAGYYGYRKLGIISKKSYEDGNYFSDVLDGELITEGQFETWGLLTDLPIEVLD